MPTAADRAATVLVDTSVAVALVVADHEHHARTTEALEGRRLGLAGHAAYETYSVLTRMPAPVRRTPDAVRRLLAATFPLPAQLSPDAAATLLGELAEAEIGGGAVYDGLVGAAAREHAQTLATRDRRALATYRVLDVDVELLG